MSWRIWRKTGQTEQESQTISTQAKTLPQEAKEEASTEELDDIVVGSVFDFEDFLDFTILKARSADIESLVILERALSKGERFVEIGTFAKYIIPAIFGILGIGIVIYILGQLGVLPF